MMLLLAQLPLVALPATAATKSGVVFEARFRPVVENPAYDRAMGQAYAEFVQPVAAWRQRVLYTLDSFPRSMVAAYDLDSLRPLSRKGLVLQRSAHTQLVDDDTGRLVVVEGTRGGATTVLEGVRLQRGTPVRIGTLSLRNRLGDPNQRVVALAASTAPRIVFLLSASVDPTGASGTFVPGTVRVTAADLEGLERGAARVLWSQILPGCRLPALAAPTTFAAAFGYEKSNSSLFFGCSSQGALGVAKPPDPVGVGRARLTGSASSPRFGTFELFPKSADYTLGAAGMYDRRAHRLVIEENTSAAGTQFAAFDGPSRAYVGSVGAGKQPLNAWGLDPVHSRFYAVSVNSAVGLLAFDVAPTPLAQGRAYPEFQTAPGFKDNSTPRPARNMEIAVDPTTGRLFVQYATVDHITVFRDHEPYFREPAPPDPDANTIDVPERPGKTGRQYAGSAQGYGAIYRQVGGTRNLQFNVVPVDVNGAEVVGGGTRELTSAYLGKLTLGGGEASAAAIADDRDSANTGADMAKANLAWPYEPAACADFGTTPRTVRATGARVHCDATRQRVSASAVGGGSSAKSGAGPVDVAVAESEVEASARLLPGSGMTVTVTSQARGVRLLGGLLRVGQVTARVQTRAHGRPGTAGSTYTRSVSDVTLAGRTLCGTRCDLERVAAQVNAQLAGRVRIDFPEPDAALAKGSPGGYQSLVKRTRAQQIEEVDLNHHPTNRAEVPGLAVTLYEDNTVPSRTLAYFAGVAAESYYGIYRLGSDTTPSRTDDPSTPEDESTVGPGGSPGDPRDTLTLDPARSATAPPPAVDGGPGGLVGALQHGIQVLANGLNRALRLFGVWAMLLVPVYLSARRWLLLSRGSLPGGPR